MRQRIICRALALIALAVVSADIALAQSTTTTEIPLLGVYNTWEIAAQVGASKGKLIVVTIDQPNRRQACRVQSFTIDKLVCARAIGGPRTYFPQQVAAVILPGDDGLRRRLLLELNAALGTAIWGTVVLAAPCPVCAAATGIVAFGLFAFAGAIGFTDDQPDRLLYLAPGQQLSKKLGFIQS
jgi:hypothetical protein